MPFYPSLHRVGQLEVCDKFYTTSSVFLAPGATPDATPSVNAAAFADLRALCEATLRGTTGGRPFFFTGVLRLGTCVLTSLREAPITGQGPFNNPSKYCALPRHQHNTRFAVVGCVADMRHIEDPVLQRVVYKNPLEHGDVFVHVHCVELREDAPVNKAAEVRPEHVASVAHLVSDATLAEVTSFEVFIMDDIEGIN
eukprot:TRINITY_DN8219_c0_g1_i1.p1 TRINITY_DN8219_c0_g1~~TRINITY_DN8219_c0_g1_i1.p1  ORF type:complete len:197 (-),score=45.49 TRINITY_DN8219_c0_g1_i1:81-671(-)